MTRLEDHLNPANQIRLVLVVFFSRVVVKTNKKSSIYRHKRTATASVINLNQHGNSLFSGGEKSEIYFSLNRYILMTDRQAMKLLTVP